MSQLFVMRNEVNPCPRKPSLHGTRLFVKYNTVARISSVFGNSCTLVLRCLQTRCLSNNHNPDKIFSFRFIFIWIFLCLSDTVLSLKSLQLSLQVYEAPLSRDRLTFVGPPVRIQTSPIVLNKTGLNKTPVQSTIPSEEKSCNYKWNYNFSIMPIH